MFENLSLNFYHDTKGKCDVYFYCFCYIINSNSKKVKEQLSLFSEQERKSQITFIAMEK